MEEQTASIEGPDICPISEVRRLGCMVKACINQPPAKASYAKPGPNTESQKHVATLIASLSNISWLLNLRGHDILYDLVFHACLFVGLESATLFVKLSKLTDDVRSHAARVQVEPKGNTLAFGPSYVVHRGVRAECSSPTILVTQSRCFSPTSVTPSRHLRHKSKK